MARRRYYRIVGIALALVVVAGGITAYNLTRPNPGAAAGCGSVQTIDPAHLGGGDRAHVAANNRPKLSDYPSVPPASGPHDSTTLSAGVYDTPPDVYQAIHSLEHGAVIVWFRPGLSSPELQRIKDFYLNPSNGDHVIVASYSYPDQGQAGRLPAGTQVAFVAWHHLQTCARPSLEAAKAFVDDFRIKPGLAPEAGAAI